MCVIIADAVAILVTITCALMTNNNNTSYYNLCVIMTNPPSDFSLRDGGSNILVIMTYLSQ